MHFLIAMIAGDLGQGQEVRLVLGHGHEVLHMMIGPEGREKDVTKEPLGRLYKE